MTSENARKFIIELHLEILNTCYTCGDATDFKIDGEIVTDDQENRICSDCDERVNFIHAEKSGTYAVFKEAYEFPQSDAAEIVKRLWPEGVGA